MRLAIYLVPRAAKSRAAETAPRTMLMPLYQGSNTGKRIVMPAREAQKAVMMPTTHHILVQLSVSNVAKNLILTSVA